MNKRDKEHVRHIIKMLNHEVATAELFPERGFVFIDELRNELRKLLGDEAAD